MNHEQIANNLSDGIDAALFEQYGAEWKRRAEQAERDRAVLAAEVEAWRRAFDEQTGKQIGDSSDCRDVSAARLTADESGALTRAR